MSYYDPTVVVGRSSTGSVDSVQVVSPAGALSSSTRLIRGRTANNSNRYISINDGLKFKQFYIPTTASNYTVIEDDYIIFSNATLVGNQTILLPVASAGNVGRILLIKNTGLGLLDVCNIDIASRGGSDLIEDSSSAIISITTEYGYCSLISGHYVTAGSVYSWYILGASGVTLI
jgi:hypothetical protein